MIKINLLQVRAGKKKETIKQQLIFGGVILILSMTIPVFMATSISGKINEANKTKDLAAGEIAAIDKEIGDLKKIEENKKVLENKLNIIDKLQTNRTGPVFMMEDLAMSIPLDLNPNSQLPKKIKLNSFRVDKDKVLINGIALDEKSLADFMTSLEKSKSYVMVNLLSTKLKDEKGYKLSDFVIDARMRSEVQDSKEVKK
jgi:type IV pilus assembly protein PilN